MTFLFPKIVLYTRQLPHTRSIHLWRLLSHSNQPLTTLPKNLSVFNDCINYRNLSKNTLDSWKRQTKITLLQSGENRFIWKNTWNESLRLNATTMKKNARNNIDIIFFFSKKRVTWIDLMRKILLFSIINSYIFISTLWSSSQLMSFEMDFKESTNWLV